LEINLERRFSKGFNLTFSYTRAMAILETGQQPAASPLHRNRDLRIPHR
jgi:hypothetical protein